MKQNYTESLLYSSVWQRQAWGWFLFGRVTNTCMHCIAILLGREMFMPSSIQPRWKGKGGKLKKHRGSRNIALGKAYKIMKKT